MKIIALTGPKTVGKTTVAKALENALSGIVVSFAKPLKQSCAMLTGRNKQYTPSDKDAYITEGSCVTWRKLYQIVGQSVCDLDPYYFTRIAEHVIQFEIELGVHGTNAIIIDDCRKDIEADMVKQYGGKVVKLHRTGIDYTGEHITETPISTNRLDACLDCGDVDACVDNILKLFGED